MNKFLKNDIEKIVEKTPNIDLSIIICEDERINFINFGKANENSFFPIASLTKPIVSTAFLELLNENTISIDTKIEEFGIKFLNKNFQNKISLKHLLTHSTGFKNSGKLFSTDKSDPYPNENNNKSNFIQELDQAPIGEVGDFAYSNNNYNILRFIIEKITKTSFEVFIINFLKKINMNFSSFFTNESIPYPDNYIKGHLYDLDENLIEIEQYPNNPINNSSFNLISSPKDMASFLLYYIASCTHNDGVTALPYPKNTIYESATTLSFNYENTLDGYYLDHNGLLATGFQSYIRLIPNENFAFCILANDLSVNIQLISDILTKEFTNGVYKHKFTFPINNTIPQVILEHFNTGFYQGYESGIVEFFIENNELYLNIFEQEYLIKYYGGNKFYFYEDNFLIEIVINFEKNKIYLNGEALIKIKEAKFINKSKIARKLQGIYQHKKNILPNIEIFKEYDNELVKIFLIDSMEEFEIFLLDSETEVILPDYGHLILKYDKNDKIIGFELDGFEEYKILAHNL